MSHERAHSLRALSTDAERRLWHFLRNRQMADCKFRRQHPVGPYVVDFACLERGIAIEADGGHHAERVTDDEQRTSFLEAKGFRVLRFWNNDVLANTEAVLESILAALMAAPSPRPSPPQAGEREKDLR